MENMKTKKFQSLKFSSFLSTSPRAHLKEKEFDLGPKLIKKQKKRKRDWPGLRILSTWIRLETWVCFYWNLSYESTVELVDDKFL